MHACEARVKIVETKEGPKLLILGKQPISEDNIKKLKQFAELLCQYSEPQAVQNKPPPSKPELGTQT